MTHTLIPGDWVEVRSASEITQSLDAASSLEGLPFMPEMVAFMGGRFRVAQRAERTCVYPPQVPLPRLSNAVVLEGLRCDGSMHGGCDLGCMFLWKESWLRPVDRRAAAESSPSTTPLAEFPVTRPGEPDRYVCQATELPRATSASPSLWKPAQYVGFVRDRTFTVPELLGMFFRIGSRKLGRLARSRSSVPRAPLVDAESLNLRPGEWVEVKTRGEILQTLDAQGMHKGLTFSGDMHQQCGRTMRVLKRVDSIIEESTGRLRDVHETVLLEGSSCARYLGCARGMPFLWREVWLRRVDPPGDGTDFSA